MTPRAQDSLVAAAQVGKAEDRLTALVAVVLQGNLDFANGLLTRAGLPRASRVEVSTEVGIASGRRVDMEVLALDGEGSVIARLWSEHKVGAAYQPEQLPAYQRALSNYSEPNRLITVVRDPRDAAPAGEGAWKVLTWWDVAQLAWQAGAQPGPDWRSAALANEALARDRLLLEFLDYLEKKEQIVVKPLKHENVLALARADETADSLIALIERAGELARCDREGKWGWARDSVLEYWQVFDAKETWAQVLDGYPELHVSPTDDWAEDRLDEPAFGAGFTLPGNLYDHLRSNSLSDWRAKLALSRVSVGMLGDHARVYRTMYVAELIGQGPTLDRQARALSDWFDESIDLINASDPGVSLETSLSGADV